MKWREAASNIIRVIKSRRMGLAGYVARIVEMRNIYESLVGKPEGQGPLRRCKCSWEDYVRMNIKETGCGICGLD
jgi:hypothetical protein